MTREERAVVLALIRLYCRPSRQYYAWSSYGLKHLFESLAGLYIGNEEFKALMQDAGFKPTPKSREDVNHRYKLEVAICREIPVEYWGRGCNARWIANKSRCHG